MSPNKDSYEDYLSTSRRIPEYYLEIGHDHILKQKPAAYVKPVLFVVYTRYMEAEKSS
jgi:hypothetical protein